MFKAYTSLCLIKLVLEKCDKNISNKNYAKLISYLSKVKELNQIVLQGLSASIKGHLCFTKEHLDNPEDLIFFFFFFFNKGNFNVGK